MLQLIATNCRDTTLLPAKVEEITEGKRANVEIIKNLEARIGSNPAIYTNKSFGVPGIKKSISKIISILSGLENNLLFSILLILSLPKKL